MTKSEVWRERVETWRGSGKSAAEFCSGQEFSAKSLQWWAWHFGAKKPKKRAATPKPGFARVVAKPDFVKSTRDASVVVLVGDARIEIGSGADRAVVSMVLESLRAPSAGGRA
ncbi:MAG: IS66 family insertion sequence element accessory protein TnpA [Myxococcota bacterium]